MVITTTLPPSRTAPSTSPAPDPTPDPQSGTFSSTRKGPTEHQAPAGHHCTTGFWARASRRPKRIWAKYKIGTLCFDGPPSRQVAVRTKEDKVSTLERKSYFCYFTSLSSGFLICKTGDCNNPHDRASRGDGENLTCWRRLLLPRERPEAEGEGPSTPCGL